MKKGFTLIEMIGVVTILAVLMMIASAPMTKVLRDFNKKAYETQIENIEKAAKIWGQDHPNELPIEISDVCCSDDDINKDNPSYIPKCLTIDLSTLQNDGYVDAKIKDTKTGKAMPNVVIRIAKLSSQRYVYKVWKIPKNDDNYEIANEYNAYVKQNRDEKKCKTTE